MGGTNEKVVTPPAAGKTINLGASSSFRIHEHKGEVHLHDDAKNTKFACPVADFYGWWKEGRARGFSPPLVMTGNDEKGNPINAKFERVIDKGKIDISLIFESVSFGDSVKLIDDFVAGK